MCASPGTQPELGWPRCAGICRRGVDRAHGRRPAPRHGRSPQTALRPTISAPAMSTPGRAPPPLEVDLDKITATVSALDTTGAAAPAQVALQAGVGGGTLQASGELHLTDGELDIKASALPLKAPPYITEAARLVLTGATVRHRQAAASATRPARRSPLQQRRAGQRGHERPRRASLLSWNAIRGKGNAPGAVAEPVNGQLNVRTGRQAHHCRRPVGQPGAGVQENAGGQGSAAARGQRTARCRQQHLRLGLPHPQTTAC